MKETALRACDVCWCDSACEEAFVTLHFVFHPTIRYC